jgi:hypothetical protein
MHVLTGIIVETYVNTLRQVALLIVTNERAMWWKCLTENEYSPEGPDSELRRWYYSCLTMTSRLSTLLRQPA